MALWVTCSKVNNALPEDSFRQTIDGVVLDTRTLMIR